MSIVLQSRVRNSARSPRGALSRHDSRQLPRVADAPLLCAVPLRRSSAPSTVLCAVAIPLSMLRAIHPHRPRSPPPASSAPAHRAPPRASRTAAPRRGATAVHTEIMGAWATKGTRPPRKKLVELGQAVSEEGDAALVIEAHRRYCLARHEMNSKRSGKLLFRACLAERNWEKVIELLAGAPRHQVFFSEWTPAREIFGAATADGELGAPRADVRALPARRRGDHARRGRLRPQGARRGGRVRRRARTLARVPSGLLRPTAAAKLLHALVDAAEAARVDEADGADDAAAAAVAACPSSSAPSGARATSSSRSPRARASSPTTRPPPARRSSRARRRARSRRREAAGDGDRRRPRGGDRAPRNKFSLCSL